MTVEQEGGLLRALAGALESKGGEDIVILDMRQLVTYTDFLLICSARNERQADSIAAEVRLRMKRDHELLPVNPGHPETAGWRVLDYLGCVVHVFTGEARQRYDLQDLWHEAPRVEPDGSRPGPKSVDAA